MYHVGHRANLLASVLDPETRLGDHPNRRYGRMKKAVLLLTAWCKECGTTVGHDMSCPCANSSYLNQDEPLGGSQETYGIKKPQLEWGEEIIGYTH